nr:helix-turn-helix domain-containing protein [uncultured Carboxylicivirga sp.]
MNTSIEQIRNLEAQANLANIGLLNKKVDLLLEQVAELGSKLSMADKEPAENETDIIQVSEVAKLIGRKPSTVYVKASKRQIPCWNDGGRLLFSRKEIERWIVANKKEKSEESATSKMRKNYKKRNSKK